MGVLKNKMQTGPIIVNDPDGPGLIKAIGKMSARLLSKHWDGIQKFRDDAEENKLKVTLKIDLDYGGGDPALKIDIGYSQSVRDRANATVTDPKQGVFTEIEAAAETEVPKPPGDNGDDGEKPPPEDEPKEEKPRGRKKRETAKAE